ncbi:MAG: sugar phosphate nucleotidyltransferase, partial [Roseibacillus sp.]
KWIRKNGVKDIVLCVSYLHETIEKYFEDGSKFGVNIEYAVSRKPLATAGQLKTAQKFIDDTFVCVYGDSLFNFSLRKAVGKFATKAVVKLQAAGQRQLVQLVLEGLPDSIDPLEVAVSRPLNQIALKGSHDFRALAEITDFEGRLALQLQQKG